MIGGLLLAGGRSSRFGSEKAVHAYGGRLLMDWPLDALLGVSDRVVVSARSGSATMAQADSRGLTVLQDSPDAPEGPLAGIQSGLQWAAGQGARWLVTSPCDAPTLTPAYLACMITTVRNGAAAAVARSAQGLEPLVAVWPVEAALPRVNDALRKGDHPPVRRLLESLAAVDVPGYDGCNINRRDDLTLLPPEDWT